MKSIGGMAENISRTPCIVHSMKVQNIYAYLIDEHRILQIKSNYPVTYIPVSLCHRIGCICKMEISTLPNRKKLAETTHRNLRWLFLCIFTEKFTCFTYVSISDKIPHMFLESDTFDTYKSSSIKDEDHALKERIGTRP